MDNCLCQEEDEEGEEEEEEGRASKLKRVRKKKHRWLILSFSHICFRIFLLQLSLCSVILESPNALRTRIFAAALLWSVKRSATWRSWR